MSNWKTLFTLSLALTPLAACGGEPACLPGTEKHAGVCVDDLPIEGMDAGPDASAPDAAFDPEPPEDAGDGCPRGTLVYVDADDDGVGAGEAIEGCPGDGLALMGGDCSPDNPAVFPGNYELCNGADDNCDGAADEGLTVRLYLDEDHDGHGDAADPGEVVCMGKLVEGKVLSNDDCDDHCETCSPANSVEATCDGKDDDCNMAVDDGVLASFLLDCDGDRYLIAMQEPQLACSVPAVPEDCVGGVWRQPGDMAAGADCNDREARSHPGAAEVCDGVDNDCDGQKDEGLTPAMYYPDCDSDGQRRLVGGQSVCGRPAIVNPVCDRSRYFVPNPLSLSDCADNDARAHRNADPVADRNGISGEHRVAGLADQDFDCDGSVEVVPDGQRCSGDQCDCWVDAPVCGIAKRRRKRVPAPGGFLCQTTSAPVPCR